jgi:DNA-binding transcriptional MerR regulator
VFSIGDFSRIARVSCRLLRYYDELGLLKPAAIERDTNYRYYTANQLPRLNRILVLKELGFTLEEIGRVIENDLSAAELRGMLLMRRADVERALAQESDRLRQIETRIAQIDTEGHLSDDDVVLRPEPARRYLSVRRIVPSFAEARVVIRQVSEAVRSRLSSSALGSLVIIAHATEFEDDCIDGEFGFILERDAPADLRLPDGAVMSVRDLAAVAKMATCVRIGLPENAHAITAKIGRFVETSGFRLAGPSREVFLEPPRPDRMDKSVVEMQFPVAAVASGSGIP